MCKQYPYLPCSTWNRRNHLSMSATISSCEHKFSLTIVSFPDWPNLLQQRFGRLGINWAILDKWQTVYVLSSQLLTTHLYWHTYNLTGPFRDAVCLHNALVVNCGRLGRDRFVKHDLPRVCKISVNLSIRNTYSTRPLLCTLVWVGLPLRRTFNGYSLWCPSCPADR